MLVQFRDFRFEQFRNFRFRRPVQIIHFFSIRCTPFHKAYVSMGELTEVGALQFEL
jgi:hypothetical protein